MIQPQFAILLHSSKSMRSAKARVDTLRQPMLLDSARVLAAYLKTLTIAELQASMHISQVLAVETQQLIDNWTDTSSLQSPAIDSFVGDVYSGLRASSLSVSDRHYADSLLWILSGQYGVLRPFDGVYPYRLEMGYRFDDPRFANLYRYWGSRIADLLPRTGPIINVSSAEYSKTIIPFVAANRIITPVFLTVSQKTGVPTFTAVHAKIARGTFARWLITSRITDTTRLREFDDLGYVFDPTTSTSQAPVFVCHVFGGLGLSIRLE